MSETLPPAAEAPWYPVVKSLSDSLVEDAGGSVQAILLYGSHVLAADPDPHSAFDFVVIVDDYGAFYRAMRESGQLGRWVWLMKALSRVLPPNVIAYAPDDGRDGIAKCLVVSRAHFERGLSARPPDHFLLGRMVQKIGYVWSATPEADEEVRGVVSRAHQQVLDWMLPYLDRPVDGAGLGRRLLQVCYQGEYRPEARNRSEVIFNAQAEHFEEVFTPVLARAAEDGILTETDRGYEPATPAPASLARYWRWHFRRSKFRSTSRWFKHTVTFDKWLPYVVRKAERHSGEKIELTLLERRLPLIFLWPRAIRFLRDRKRSR